MVYSGHLIPLVVSWPSMVTCLPVPLLPGCPGNRWCHEVSGCVVRSACCASGGRLNADGLILRLAPGRFGPPGHWGLVNSNDSNAVPIISRNAGHGAIKNEATYRRLIWIRVRQIEVVTIWVSGLDLRAQRGSADSKLYIFAILLMLIM